MAGFYHYGQTHHLLLSLENVDPRELADIQCGKAEFGIGEMSNLMFLFFRFGETIGWSDGIYNWHLDSRKETPTDEDQILEIKLFDVNEQQTIATREIKIPTYFGRTANQIVDAQKRKTFSVINYWHDLYTAYNEMTSEDLVTEYGKSFFGEPTCS
jgi:hypothetical protein